MQIRGRRRSREKVGQIGIVVEYFAISLRMTNQLFFFPKFVETKKL